MALTLVHYDGFDDYATADIPKQFSAGDTASFAISAGTGRNGTNSLTGNSSGERGVQINVPASAAFLVSFAIKIATYPSSAGDIFRTADGVTTHLTLSLSSTGVLSVTRNATPLADSGAFVLLPGQYYCIVIAGKIADTPDGTYDVWVNGTKRITTGVNNDTRNGGNASISNVQLHNSYPAQSYFDDFAIFVGPSYTDGDYPGDCRVFSSLPAGNGNYAVWVASAGTGYSCVDDNPENGDTDYISSATPNDLSTFTFPAIAGAGTVKGVMDVITDRMDDAGPRQIATVARLGVTDVVGASQSCSVGYVVHKEVLLTKPGGGAWALSDVNSAELGVKLVS